MTQSELREVISVWVKPEWVDEVMKLINQHVTEVIGEDDNHECTQEWCTKNYINTKLAEQRKRAGL